MAKVPRHGSEDRLAEDGRSTGDASRLTALLAALAAAVPALAQEEDGRPLSDGPAPPKILVTAPMLERGEAIY